MRRTAIFATIAFLAGLAIGFFARSALERIAHAVDLAAIEKAHQKDIEVTLSQDPKGLLELWSDDAVAIYPGKPPAVGKQAIEGVIERFHAQYPGLKVLRYTAKYRGLQIEDGLACEWGEHEAEFSLAPNTPPTNWHAGAFTVLRRQSDGSWKAVTNVPSE